MNEKKPLVSIIIPVYNHEAYVTDALNSVFNQTYENLEIIIIDDGSIDDSVGKIEKAITPWKDKRNIVFIKQPNRGAHVAINKGLSLANGEWLTILNSDDIYDIKRISTCIKSLIKNNREFGFTLIKGIDKTGKELHFNHPWKRWYDLTFSNVSNYPGLGFLFVFLRANVAVSSGNFIFTKALFRKIGPFKHYRWAHDLDFLLRVVFHTEPLIIREELYLYRLHNSNTNSNFTPLFHEDLNEMVNSYLLSVKTTPPINKLAPCHQFFPAQFESKLGKVKEYSELSSFLKKSPIPKNAQQSNHLLSQKVNGPCVTLITHELSLTGAPKVVVDLSLVLKENGYRVNVISLLDGPMRQQLENAKIPLYVLPRKISFWTHKTSSLKGLIALCLSIPFVLPRLSRTIIANSIGSASIVLPVSLFFPFKKMFWFIHENFSPYSFFTTNLGCNFLEKVKKKENVDFIFGSKSTKMIWNNSGFKGNVFHWSGIESSEKPAIKNNRITRLLNVGYCSPRKGTHILVEAFIQCVKQKLIPDDVTLTIVGFSETKITPFCSDVISKVSKEGLLDRILFMSDVQPDQLELFYENADLYVHSSLQECLPLALLKAMSLGLPIVTTDVDGCKEAIEHEKSGYLCPPQDINALAKVLASAIQNPKKSYELGWNAKKIFDKEFSLEKNKTELLNLLETSII